MRTVSLRDLLRPVASWNPARRPTDEFDYVDLSAVDSRTKTITAAARIRGGEAPSRARQLIEAGDVLFSTVRPNLNAVAVVPPHLQGATASTGFTVLRAGSELDNRYLFHWTRSAPFVSDMVKKATGASYPAVSDRIVKDSPLPAPRLREQRRIAEILDQADALRAKRRQVLAHLDALTASMFRDMFDLAALPRRRFHEVVGDLEGGRSLVAEDSAAKSAYRVLKISAVTGNRFRADESKPLPNGYEPPPRHLVRHGDLLFSRANTSDLVGAVALVEGDPRGLALPDKLWRFVWRDAAEVEPLFVWALLQRPEIRRELSSLASGTGGSMKNISKAKLNTLQLPWPSVTRQREFAARVSVVRRRSGHATQLAERADQLFAALQYRAFRGEL